MAGLKYTIEPHRITIWPKPQIARLAMVMCIIFLALFLVTACIAPQSWPMILILSAFTVLVFLLPLFVGRQQAVFDAENRIFYRVIAGFRVGKIPFDEIAHISVVSHSGMSTGKHFNLALKKNVHARGIALSLAYLPDSTQYKTWVNELQPAINRMLQANTLPVIQPEQTITDFVFYKNNDGVYTAWSSSVFARVMAILVGGSFISFSVYGLIRYTGSDVLYSCAFLLIGVLLCGSAFHRVTINREEMIKSRFFGLSKTRQQLINFENFIVLRKKTNGMYTGTDINARFKGYKGSITTRTFYGTKNIQRFLDETRAAMTGR